MPCAEVRERCAWPRRLPPDIAGGEGDHSRGSEERRLAFALARFSTRIVIDAAVVRVEGEVDISSASHLVQAIAQAYRVIRCVIVDLTDLAYRDGSGIRVLRRASRANRGRFVVVASTRNILRIFEVMNLLDELPVTSSVRAAQEYLRLQEMGECGGT